MSKSKATIISLIALGLAIVAIVLPLLPFCRVVLHKIDSFGLLAAVLSILVTVLIVWNIYTLVDFKENIKEFNEIKDEINRLRDETDRLKKSKQDKKSQVAHNIGELGKPGQDDQNQDTQD